MARTAKKDDVETKTIHPEVTKSLISKAEGLMAEMDKPRGELGSHYKDVEKTHKLNRKGFKTILTLHRMEETQRNDFLRTFDTLRDQMNWNAQADMFNDRPAASAAAPAAGSETEWDQAAADKKQVADNVTRLKGIKPTAEATA